MPDASNYRIIRSSRRKQVALRIADDGTVEILAPEKISDQILHQMFMHSGDIVKKLQLRRTCRPAPAFTENSQFWLLGRLYPLHLTRRLCLFDHAFMIPDGSNEDKKAALITLYKELSRHIIINKVTRFQEICHLYPEKININSATTRWGSCSGKKTISFSWKLIQCPEELVDYVVVHELAHLKEMNHSQAFWAEVGKIIPDYADHRAALRKFARQLPHW
ncbi:MAG: M48 family metallopeptidase [Lentisphaeria bacterium]|nr:M48 family metallopeptidase [Lentisphaeria bacterium]